MVRASQVAYSTIERQVYVHVLSSTSYHAYFLILLREESFFIAASKKVTVASRILHENMAAAPERRSLVWIFLWVLQTGKAL